MFLNQCLVDRTVHTMIGTFHLPDDCNAVVLTAHGGV